MFCDINPTCYKIALQKEICKRHIKNFLGHEVYAALYDTEPLPQLVSACSSHLIKRGKGIEPKLQENKAININLANQSMNGILLRPGETFSFWHLIGRCTARRGYLPGLAISNGAFREEAGGGQCQLANLIHYLVLHTPLEVTELHHHSDALFPDSERRVPFGTGTSVFYCNVDYRFCNTSGVPVQLSVWVDGELLCGELRAEKPFPLRYRLIEEGSCYTREADGFYRNSRVYRRCFERESGRELPRELILVNHSKVMYDPSLIPPEQLAGEGTPCRCPPACCAFRNRMRPLTAVRRGFFPFGS